MADPIETTELPQPPADDAVQQDAAAPAPQAAQQPLPHGPEAMKAVGDIFKDPEALQGIAASFLKNGSKTGLQWLERAHEAAKENLYEAVGHLDVNDPAGAVKAFNKSGRFNDATGATKNDDGSWTVTRASAPPVTFKTDDLKRTLLAPHDYFTEQRADKTAAAQTDYYKAHADEARGRADWYKDRNQTARDIQEMKDTQRDRDAVWKGLLQEAKQAGAQGVADFNMKHGPEAIYSSSLSAFKDTDDPVGKATAATIASPSIAPPQMSPDGQTVRLVNAITGRVWKEMPAAQYTKLTGNAVPAPKAAGGPAATKTSASAPPGPAGGLSQAPVNPGAKAVEDLDDDQLKSVAADPKVQKPVQQRAQAELQRRSATRGGLSTEPPPLY
jgi:hypothetical protein